MNQILKFLSEVKAEFHQISWPKRESLIQLTIVVISISIIVSLVLGGFDYLFTQGISLLGTAPASRPANQTKAPLVTIAPQSVIITATPSAAVTTKPIKK